MDRGKLIKTAAAIFSALLGIYIIAGLIRIFNVDFSSFSTDISKISGIYLAVIVVLTALNFLFSSVKWSYLSNADSHQGVSFFVYYVTVAFSTLVMAVLPQSVALVTARSAVFKITQNKSFRKTLLTVLYETFLTAYTVLLFFPLTILAVIYGVSSFTVLSGVVCAVFLVLMAPWLMKVFIHTAIFALKKAGKTYKANEIKESLRATTLFSWRRVSFVFVLSLVQHINLALRNYFILLCAGMSLGIWKIMLAYPTVFIANMIGVTPGSLGITEWSWTGLLISQGVGPQAAFEYAVVNRLLILFSQISVFLITVSVFIMTRRRKVQT